MADLAVVLVSWNVRALILDALKSLIADLNANGPAAEIFLVDSASSDGTVEAVNAEFPQVHVIASSENLGFAGGNNRALREIGFGAGSVDALPKAVYFLNCDTITQQGATRSLYDALMADTKIGLVGARLSYGDGSFQHSAFAFPDLPQLWVEFFPTPGRLIESRFNGRYPRQLYDSGKIFAVDCVLGAAMMLKREVIAQTGVFDEQFFMYCEEIDWAWRIRKAGWEVCCVPSAHVIHLSGQSTSQIRAQSIINLWTSRLRLFAKHYSRMKRQLARWMIVTGMRLKITEVEKSPDHTLPEKFSLVGAYQTIIDLAMKSD